MVQKAKTNLIVGGNGKTGRRVAERLARRGLPVRLASRSSETPLDWEDSSTWAPALEGAASLYLTYYPDLSVPGAAAQVEALTQQAVRSGVSRIVLLAGRGEPQVKPAEDAVRNSGLEYTILECAFFSQNFSEGLLGPQEGVVFFPGGSVTEPFIDCDDIADVAVEALTDAAHVGKTYELTGPRALSFGEATALMAKAAGRPLKYVSPSFEEYAQVLSQHMPRGQVDFFVDLFRFLLDGHNSFATDDVARVLGRPARDFADYAMAAAPAWRA